MSIKISARKFEALVVQALEELPAFFKDRLQNIEVLVADWPTEEELEEAGLGPDELLLGLYQGISLTERTGYYGMVLPDTITLGPRHMTCAYMGRNSSPPVRGKEGTN